MGVLKFGNLEFLLTLKIQYTDFMTMANVLNM